MENYLLLGKYGSEASEGEHWREWRESISIHRFITWINVFVCFECKTKQIASTKLSQPFASVFTSIHSTACSLSAAAVCRITVTVKLIRPADSLENWVRKTASEGEKGGGEREEIFKCVRSDAERYVNRKTGHTQTSRRSHGIMCSTSIWHQSRHTLQLHCCRRRRHQRCRVLYNGRSKTFQRPKRQNNYTRIFITNQMKRTHMQKFHHTIRTRKYVCRRIDWDASTHPQYDWAIFITQRRDFRIAVSFFRELWWALRVEDGCYLVFFRSRRSTAPSPPANDEIAAFEMNMYEKKKIDFQTTVRPLCFMRSPKQ